MKIASMILIPIGAAVTACFYILFRFPITTRLDLAVVPFSVGVLLLSLGILFLVYSLKAKK